MTANFYENKKLLVGLELPNCNIHVCPDGCMLFWKDIEELEKRLICGGKRYQQRQKNRQQSINLFFQLVVDYKDCV